MHIFCRYANLTYTFADVSIMQCAWLILLFPEWLSASLIIWSARSCFCFKHLSLHTVNCFCILNEVLPVQPGKHRHWPVTLSHPSSCRQSHLCWQPGPNVPICLNQNGNIDSERSNNSGSSHRNYTALT